MLSTVDQTFNKGQKKYILKKVYGVIKEKDTSDVYLDCRIRIELSGPDEFACTEDTYMKLFDFYRTFTIDDFMLALPGKSFEEDEAICKSVYGFTKSEYEKKWQ